MPQIPRDAAPDSTLALLRAGYRFISERCEKHGSDIFETRLMFRRIVCMRGEDAAQVFYSTGRFSRRHAMPASVLRLLQDEGSVQLLEDAAHRHRKHMFLSLMTPAAMSRLEALMIEEWRLRAATWEGLDRVPFHAEMQEILCRVACRWVGLSLDAPAIRRRTREFSGMIESAGAVGPRNWQGQVLRTRSEHWGRRIIAQIRAESPDTSDDCPARAIAWHRDTDGRLLDLKVAAVELLNLLRPMVAVANFLTFAALAMHDHPDSAARLIEGDDRDGEREAFAQEVRRYYPFFPFIGGRVRAAFSWNGYHFARGDHVLLDLYGTDHDARLWTDPERFRPERFREGTAGVHAFIPQGAGDPATTHRCPGETPTVVLIKTALHLLTEGMRYEVPAQDLTVTLARIPALPASGLMIGDVRLLGR